MTRNPKLDREKKGVTLEEILRLVKGGEEKQHVDNPGQTPMKDGLS